MWKNQVKLESGFQTPILRETKISNDFQIYKLQIWRHRRN